MISFGSRIRRRIRAVLKISVSTKPSLDTPHYFILFRFAYAPRRICAAVNGQAGVISLNKKAGDAGQKLGDSLRLFGRPGRSRRRVSVFWKNRGRLQAYLPALPPGRSAASSAGLHLWSCRPQRKGSIFLPPISVVRYTTSKQRSVCSAFLNSFIFWEKSLENFMVFLLVRFPC